MPQIDFNHFNVLRSSFLHGYTDERDVAANGSVDTYDSVSYNLRAKLGLLTKCDCRSRYGKIRKRAQRGMARQLKQHMVTMEGLMPQEHFLRKLEWILDLSFVYEETRPLYSQKYGRPPIDPLF